MLAEMLWENVSVTKVERKPLPVATCNLLLGFGSESKAGAQLVAFSDRSCFFLFSEQKPSPQPDMKNWFCGLPVKCTSKWLDKISSVICCFWSGAHKVEWKFINTLRWASKTNFVRLQMRMPFLWLLWSLLSIALFRIWPPNVSKIGSTFYLFDTLLPNALFSLHKKHIRNLLLGIWFWGLFFLVRRFLVRLHVSFTPTLAGEIYLHNLCEISDVAETTSHNPGRQPGTPSGWRWREVAGSEHFIYQSVARKMLYPRFIVTEKMLYRCQTTNSGAAKNINAWISYLSIFRDFQGESDVLWKIKGVAVKWEKRWKCNFPKTTHMIYDWWILLS